MAKEAVDWGQCNFTREPFTERLKTCANFQCRSSAAVALTVRCDDCKGLMYCSKACATAFSGTHWLTCKKGTGGLKALREFLTVLANHKDHQRALSMADAIIMAAGVVVDKNQTAVQFDPVDADCSPETERKEKVLKAIPTFAIALATKPPSLGPKANGPSIGLALFAVIGHTCLQSRKVSPQMCLLFASLLDGLATTVEAPPFTWLTLAAGQFTPVVERDVATPVDVYRHDMQTLSHSFLYLIHLVPHDQLRVREISLILWRLGDSAMALSALNQMQTLADWITRHRDYVDEQGYAHLEMPNATVLQRFLPDLMALGDAGLNMFERREIFLRVFSLPLRVFELSKLLHGEIPRNEFPLYRMQMCRMFF